MSTHTIGVVLRAPGSAMHPAVADGTISEIEQVVVDAAAAEVTRRVELGLLPEGCDVAPRQTP